MFLIFAAFCILSLTGDKSGVITLLLPVFVVQTMLLILKLFEMPVLNPLVLTQEEQEFMRLNAIWILLKFFFYLFVFYVIVNSPKTTYIAISVDFFVSFIFVPPMFYDREKKIFNPDGPQIFRVHLLVFTWIMLFSTSFLTTARALR